MSVALQPALTAEVIHELAEHITHWLMTHSMTSDKVTYLLQGLMLISPSLDAERTFVSSILEKLQGIALLLCPNARIVPSPPFEQCTDVPELVRPDQFLASCLLHGLLKGKLSQLLLEVRVELPGHPQNTAFER